MVYVGLNPIEITDFDTAKEFSGYPMEEISAEKVSKLLQGDYHSCCKQEHKPVLDIVKRRMGVNIEIPLVSERYPLRKGDRVIIVVVANIRRLVEGERYTHEELRKARDFFRLYKVR